MEDDKLKQKIKELDESVPKDGAIVQFKIYGGGLDEGFIQANRNGYLRLGIEFLKAAYAPFVKENDKTNKNIVDIDIGYLTDENAPIRFDWFERKENITSLTKDIDIKPGGFKDAVSLLGYGTILFIVIMVFLMGIFAIIDLFK